MKPVSHDECFPVEASDAGTGSPGDGYLFDVCAVVREQAHPEGKRELNIRAFKVRDAVRCRTQVRWRAAGKTGASVNRLQELPPDLANGLELILIEVNRLKLQLALKNLHIRTDFFVNRRATRLVTNRPADQRITAANSRLIVWRAMCLDATGIRIRSRMTTEEQ
jgi:hypothetical protein